MRIRDLILLAVCAAALMALFSVYRPAPLATIKNPAMMMFHQHHPYPSDLIGLAIAIVIILVGTVLFSQMKR